jgi:hypothetical protein
MSKHWITALSLLVAGSAFAEGTFDWPLEQPWSSTLTRAEVRAALFATDEAQPEPSTLTRAQVRAEMFAARERGEADAFIGEDSGSFHLARLQGGASERHFASGVRLLADAPR